MRMFLLKAVLLVCITTPILFNLAKIQGTIIPVKIAESKAHKLLNTLGIDDRKLASSYDMASRRTGLSRELLIALTYTESTFKQRAISSKNYNGLMQIPYPLWRPDTNVLVGAYILCDKLRVTNGDLRQALSLYKGYGISERGLQQADKVLKLYKQLLKEEV